MENLHNKKNGPIWATYLTPQEQSEIDLLAAKKAEAVTVYNDYMRKIKSRCDARHRRQTEKTKDQS